MKYDAIVCLGDLMDDWNQEKDLGDYTLRQSMLLMTRIKWINEH